MNQFEIWYCKPPGFAVAHYFVILSSPERCQNPQALNINALIVSTLQGEPKPIHVVLDQADGLDNTSTCQCDYFYTFAKSCVWAAAAKGTVTEYRQKAIKDKLVSIFRLD